MQKEYLFAIVISLVTAWASQWVQESPEMQPPVYMAASQASPLEAELRGLRISLMQARTAQPLTSSFLEAPKGSIQ